LAICCFLFRQGRKRREPTASIASRGDVYGFACKMTALRRQVNSRFVRLRQSMVQSPTRFLFRRGQKRRETMASLASRGDVCLQTRALSACGKAWFRARKTKKFSKTPRRLPRCFFIVQNIT